MKLSVLVVSYEVRDLLRGCLASLGADVEIVVVDNASRDGTPEMVRTEFPRVKLVSWEENRGFSAAVNAAARLASGDAFLLLNPDAQLPVDAHGRMLAFFDANPDAWAVGFRQVDEHGRFQLAFGLQPSLAAELLRQAVQRRLDKGDDRLATLLDRFTQRAPVAWVAGSSLLVRRSAFERVGGFDERFFLYFEDIDFCLRLQQAGGLVYYEPFLTVEHRRGASAAKSNGLARRAYRESQLYFWEKHRGRLMRYLVHAYLAVRGESPRQLST